MSSTRSIPMSSKASATSPSASRRLNTVLVTTQLSRVRQLVSPSQSGTSGSLLVLGIFTLLRQISRPFLVFPQHLVTSMLTSMPRLERSMVFSRGCVLLALLDFSTRITYPGFISRTVRRCHGVLKDCYIQRSGRFEYRLGPCICEYEDPIESYLEIAIVFNNRLSTTLTIIQ